MEPIRILHVVASLTKRGGVMSSIMNLYRNINHTNIQFDFLVNNHKEPNYREEIISYGGRIFDLPPLNKKNLIKYSNEVRSFFNNSDYDILHCHVPAISPYILYLAEKKGIKNRIIHSHGTMYGEGYLKSIRNYLSISMSKRNSNIYYACSHAAGQFMFGEKLMNNDQVTIINNAIDTNKFKFNKNLRRSLRKDLNIEDKLVIGHVGSFSPVKNHEFIIDIFHEVKNINNNSVLLLIGEGPLKKAIYEKVQKLGLQDSVMLLGTRTDINELMQAMDVFVLPSYKEGFPVVSVEAQASGLNCFISNTVTKEVKLTNLVHLLSIKEDPKLWATQIIKIYQNSYREDTSEQIISKGFDTKINAKNLENYYKRLLSLNRQ